MSKKHNNRPRTFWADFKLFFLRGLVILLPSVLTLWILVMAYRFVEANVAEPINAGIRTAVLGVAPRVFDDSELPSWFAVSQEQIDAARDSRRARGQQRQPTDALRRELRKQQFQAVWDTHWYLRVIGLAVAIILIYLAGLLLGGFIGRRIYSRFEKYFTRAPVIKSVYPHVKQVVDFLFASDERRPAVQNVVLVEYPRQGIWTIGLMTGTSLASIEEVAADECVTVFIPSSPTPFTGYTITVKRSEAINMPISIDEALRFVVSGGVLVPDRQQVKRAGGPEARKSGDLADAKNPAMIEGGESASKSSDENAA